MSTVSPLPFQGGVFRDSRDENRWLRVSWHDERRMFVVSIWHVDECIAAFQLDAADVPAVVQALMAAIPTGVTLRGQGSAIASDRPTSPSE